MNQLGNMLTETMSDPRRANWLTISSMSEDLCWPEENNNSRPSWELEAEILRLTTRLMMRERELKQVKSQLKTQVSKSQQQANNWRKKIEEKEEQMRELLIQKDTEMQGIVSQLLLFEAELRQEQSRIEKLLCEKDAQISSQQKELERLQNTIDSQISNFPKHNTDIRKNGSLSSYDSIDKDIFKTAAVHRRSFSVDDSTDSHLAVQKLKDGLLKIRGIQDVTNVKTPIEMVFDPVNMDKKRIPYRPPQKMKDLKAKRMNSHNKIHRPVISEICAQAIL